MDNKQTPSESGFLLLCSASGRLVYCSDSLRLLLGENPSGRNLNDYFDDVLAAQIIAHAASNENFDFSCTLIHRLFIACAESISGSIHITFYPAEGKTAPTIWPSAVGLVAREANSALNTAFLALNEIRPQLIGEAREDGALLSRALYRLLRLSSNLTSFSKAEQGELRLHLTEEDAVKKGENLMLRLSELCSGGNVHLSFVPLSDSVMLRADWGLVERILLNLISNALAVQWKGGEIVLSVQSKNNEVVFTVTDQGPGIVDTGDIFNKISTGNPGNPDTTCGAGLGLALSRAFASLHGGQILCTNEQGTTVFSVVLPREPEGILEAPVSTVFSDSGNLDRMLIELSTVIEKDFY